MRKYIFILAFFVIAFLLFKIPTDKFGGLGFKNIKPIEPIFQIMEKPVLCSFEQKQIEKIKSDSKPLKNGAGYKYWDVELSNSEKVFIITKNENPYLKGQQFLVATNCKLIDEKKISELKSKINNQEKCMNIYRYDKKTYQIKLECGYMTDQGTLFF